MKLLVHILAAYVLLVSVAAAAKPVCVDQRLDLDLFSEAPQIVQPVSAAFDRNGRLLVIENHTHFRPDDYDGPTTDRILVVSDTVGDGVADSHEVFFEGERDSMDLAVHADGSVYLATRRKIVRLVDSDADGVADQNEEIIRLETEGNYPHNGLSGLVFDIDGKLQFGFGENLGASYTLVGSDNTKLTGGAEGGSTYRCNADGSELERIATGFWNPFGQCMDAFGNIFAVDNDPDATPPCRLLHVTAGANFGYQFRYGRPGNHPLQTWTGELPGTIGMVAGTGEAPCEVVYCMPAPPNAENGLPEDYIGDLLVASWGDHRIERFRLSRKGASFEASRTIVVQGDTSFWPVGLAFAPDGSLIVTDWGSRSYPLHGEGKIWRLSSKTKQLSKKKKPGPLEKEMQLALRMRDPQTTSNELRQIANSAATIRLRAFAVRLLGSRQEDVSEFADAKRSLPIRREAFCYLEAGDNKNHEFRSLIESGLRSDDPTIQSLAVHALTRNVASVPSDWFTGDFFQSPHANDADRRALVTGVALATEALDAEYRSLIPAMLRSPNEDVRFVAARWAADRERVDHLPEIEQAIKKKSGDFRTLLGLVAAQRHLLGEKLNDGKLTQVLSRILKDEEQSPGTKALAIRAASNGSLAVDLLKGLFETGDSRLKREVIYLLQNDTREQARTLLREIVEDETLSAGLRADALVAVDAQQHEKELVLKLASHESSAIRHTALRMLTAAELTNQEKTSLRLASKQTSDSGELELTERILAQPADNVKKLTAEDWLGSLSSELISGGSAERGRRLFHNARLVQCSKCHQVGNRGADIGPELTGIGKNQSPELLIRSIVHPSERIAPQYQPWVIIDKNGRAQTGYHLASKRLVETFVQSSGEQFQISQDEIEERVPGEQSIMPTGLIDHLTVSEVRDLLAYLSE